MSEIAVAIIEDNLDLQDDLMLNLTRRGIACSAFASGEAFDAALKGDCPWTVLVLDLGLPGEDGLSIARRLRKTHPALGIVMLTARGTVDERIRGMNQGADVYLVKPADMNELAAAIRSVSRRVAAPAAAVPAWRLDPLGLKLFSPGGCAIQLTHPESSLIRMLAESPNHFGERDALVAAMGKNPAAYDPRALEVTLSRLRHKLGDDPPLKAVRSRGYIFTAMLVVLAASKQPELSRR